MKVAKSSLYYISNLITKIIFLMRMIRVSDGNVLLYTKSKKLKFVVFVATLLADRILYVVDKDNELYTMFRTKMIGTVFIDRKESTSLWRVKKDADLFGIIDEEILFKKHESFKFFRMFSYAFDLAATYIALHQQSFKDERQAFVDNWKFRLTTKKTGALNIRSNNNRITYSMANIEAMLDAIDSEFGEEQYLYAGLIQTKFEQTFAYFLYFFLKGHMVDLGRDAYVLTMLMNIKKKLKKLIFIDNSHFQDNWHYDYKYKVYSQVNKFLRRWKLTNWITVFTYQRIIKLQDRDEIVLINPDRAKDREEFLAQTRTKISVIFGTPADGYTLGINRYNDKDISILDNSFRVMDANSTIKIAKDKLNRLTIAGSRVPANLKKVIAIQSKTNTAKYHMEHTYCDINGEILTIKANLEDLYYEGNTIIDVGTKRRSLMAVPYIKQVDVLKYRGRFVCVVELDREFIKETWENPTLLTVLAHLWPKVNEINSDFDDSEEISKIIVSSKFFDGVEAVNHIISKKNYIEYLNRQPFNQEEGFEKDRIDFN